MIGELPRKLCVNGKNYAIRTDRRDILKIIKAFNDPNLEDHEKAYVCLFILYRDFYKMPKDDYDAALEAAGKFIDGDNGSRGDKDKQIKPTVMDWEQDEAILFPEINKIAGYETRSAKYIHWWTFLGFYMAISEGVFSQVLSIRSKKAKGKKLESWEREFWNANKSICVLKQRLSDEEQAKKDRLNALLR